MRKEKLVWSFILRGTRTQLDGGKIGCTILIECRNILCDTRDLAIYLMVSKKYYDNIEIINGIELLTNSIYRSS